MESALKKIKIGECSKMSICKKIEKKLQNYPYALFALRCIRRIAIRDIDYISFALNEYSNPKRISIKSLGEENRGEIIYCINELGRGCGFFAEFRTLLCYLIFAEEMGFVPNVFWGNHHLYYDKDIAYTDNVFEYYFEPIKVEDFRQSLNVCFSSVLQYHYVEKEYGVNGYSTSEDFEEKLVQMIKKYIHIRPELICDFEIEMNQVLCRGNVLGIHHRGTDYKKGYREHPKGMQIEQGIAQAKKILQEYRLDNIFLATDDEEILDAYKVAFGEMVHYYPDVKRGLTDVSVAFSQENRECHHYTLGREVLRDVYTLSKCTCLLSGKSQVSYCANLLNRCGENRYLKYELIDNGINDTGAFFKGERTEK